MSKFKNKKWKSVYESLSFTNITVWQRFKLWVLGDVFNFFLKIWWKVIGKY